MEEQTAQTGGGSTSTNPVNEPAMSTTEVRNPSSSTSGPTFRDRLGATFAPLGERFQGPTAFLSNLISGGYWVYGIITILLIAALILPPISLAQRLGISGYTRLDADTPSISHPDGMTIRIDPETASGLRVALDSVPRLDLLEGSAGSQLREAIEALPNYLQIKSPFYRIDVGARVTGPATIEVAIPNDAEPWATLDLYTWDGSKWQWVGGTLDLEQEVLVAQVDTLPESVAIVQTVPVVPAIGTVAMREVDGPAADVLTEVLLPGLYLGTDGLLLGSAPLPFSENPAPLLLLRNWQEGQPVSHALLADVLNNPEIQATHVENVLAQVTGFSGVALDYQGVAVEDRAAFSALVTTLAERLHEQGARLEVVVPLPTPAGSEWDSGGYDWRALGASADAVIVTLPVASTAYADSGQVDDLLRWGVGQVNRFKLRLLVSTLNADVSLGQIRYLGLNEVLAPFGQVSAPADTALEPADEVSFTLVGQVTSIVRDETAGTYEISYHDADGAAHTAWLGTPSFLARKLDWALQYHLGGVVVTDLNDNGNLPGMLEAVRGYREATELSLPGDLEVVWTVTGPEASASQEVVSLSQPDFRWTAPEQGGTYTVLASIAGVSRGSVQMTVSATPTPVPTPVVTDTATTTARTASGGDTSCLQAAFIADVTVPDGTHMEKGEAFVKTWRLRNSGTCDWPADTVLTLVSSEMGGPQSVEVGAVAVGETVDISVDLAAPNSDGNFDGLWKLQGGGVDIPGGSVTAVIQAGTPPVAAAPAAAPAAITPIVGGSFELGGHVRDLAFTYGSQMHYAGMNWAKVQVRYRGDAAGIVAAAHANGFKIQLSALGGATQVTQPGFDQDIASWVAGMAAAGADAIEVWNEPNIDREWQSGYIDPAAYTRLLCAAYQAIKAANPGTAVISAAPAPTGYFGGCGPGGCDDEPWVRGMYAAGAANCMDYIGAHHNSGATSPSARSGHPAGTHHSWYFLPQTELYYNIFGGTRKLFYTEMGYASSEGVEVFPGNFSWAQDNNNAEQAAWLAEAAQIGANTGMVRCIIVWNVDYLARVPGDPQDGYAIIRPGGSCPACEALHAVLGSR